MKEYIENMKKYVDILVLALRLWDLEKLKDRDHNEKPNSLLVYYVQNHNLT